jgi:hypothetical protein
MNTIKMPAEHGLNEGEANLFIRKFKRGWRIVIRYENNEIFVSRKAFATEAECITAAWEWVNENQMPARKGALAMTEEPDDALKTMAWEIIREFSQEHYLGDGLYCSFSSDGMTVKLRAPRGFDDHYVILEPDVLAAFEQYLAKLRKALAAVEVTL